MGHVLSFPILCIANYIAFRYAFRFQSKTPNVKVNGDDILFCTYPEQYKTWLSTIPKFGFIPSVGKNLFSSRVAQINSVLFRVSKFNLGTISCSKSSDKLEIIRELICKVEPVPYCNFGILTQRGKGKGVNRVGLPEEMEDTEMNRLSVLPSLQRYIRQLPGDQPQRALRIMEKNHPFIRKLSKQVNYPFFDSKVEIDPIEPFFDASNGQSAGFSYELRGKSCWLSIPGSLFSDAQVAAARISELRKELGEKNPLSRFQKFWKQNCKYVGLDFFEQMISASMAMAKEDVRERFHSCY